MELSSLTGVILWCLLFFSGVVLFFKGRRWWQDRTRLKNLSVSRIVNLQPGLAALKGRIKPILTKSAGQLVSKTLYGGKECVYHSYLLENRGGWLGRLGLLRELMHFLNQKRGRQNWPFLLDDGSGTVLIQAREEDFKVDKGIAMSSFDIAPGAREEFCSFLEKNGFSLPRNVFKSVFYQEKLLEPGDEVYVLGKVTTRDCMDPDWDLGNARKYSVAGSGEVDLLVTDQNPALLAKVNEFKALGAITGASLIILTASLGLMKIFFPAWFLSTGTP